MTLLSLRVFECFPEPNQLRNGFSLNLSLTHRQTLWGCEITYYKARSVVPSVVVVFETNFIQHAYKHFTLARHFVTKRRKFKQFSNRKCCATDTLLLISPICVPFYYFHFHHQQQKTITLFATLIVSKKLEPLYKHEKACLVFFNDFLNTSFAY